MPFFQSGVDPQIKQIIQHGKQRHTDQHTDKAEQAAEQQQRKRDPERGYAGRLAEHTRRNDIPLDLLQHDDKYNKDQSLAEIGEQDQRRADHRTDDRSEKRDHIRHPDDHTDEQRIRHPHQRHADKADDRDDQGFDDHTGEIAAHDLVGMAGGIQHLIGALFPGKRAQQLFGLRQKTVLVFEHINGDDHSHRQVEDAFHDADHAGRHIGQQRICHAGQTGRRPVLEEFQPLLQPLLDHDCPFRIVIDPSVDPIDNGTDLRGKRFGGARNAVADLRDDQNDQHDQQRRHKQHRQGDRDPLGCALRPLRPLAALAEQTEKSPLHPRLQGIEQIRQHKSDQHGRQRRYQRAERIADLLAAV